MRTYCRTAVAFVTALVMVATMTACTSSGSDDESVLTLYSGQHEKTTKLIVAAFERQTGLSVKVRFDDESALANEIADAESKRSADVFWAENTPAMRLLERKHLLERLPEATLARVDSRWRSESGDYIGVSARVGAMVYNIDRLQPAQLPMSLTELAEPKWKGKIGIAPADTDFQAVVASYLITHGQQPTLDWLAGLKANAGSFVYTDNEVLADAVNRDQVQLGVMNQHSWFRERDKVGAARLRSGLAFFEAQDSGYLLDISAAAVPRTSHAPAAAQKLVEFLVSRTGAQIIARNGSYEYPLGSNVEATKALREFNGLQPVSVSFNDLGFETRVVGLLREAGLL